MSFVPDFELGLWNAWVLIVPLIIYWLSGVKFLFSKRMPDSTPPTKRKDKTASSILVISMFFSFFYSIFVTLKLGTIWFIIGLVVYLAGIVLINLTIINFAATPIDKPVTKGVYRFSRNPMFIGFFLVYAGISIACISGLYMVLTILFVLMVHYLSSFEETVTLGHYGKAYEEYIKRTPKWIGFPKK